MAPAPFSLRAVAHRERRSISANCSSTPSSNAFHHRFVHVALGADRRRVARSSAAAAMPRAPAGAGARSLAAGGRGRALRARRRSEQRAEILQRNLHARDLAQETVDLVRARRDAAPPSSPRYWNRRLPGNFASTSIAPATAAGSGIPFRRLAALGAEFQRDGRAIDRDVRLEQRRGAARAARLRIALAARTDGAARDELDHRRERELARRLGGAEMLSTLRRMRGSASTRRAGGAPCASRAPSPNPDDSGTAGARRHRARSPGCARRIGGVEHVLIGRRHRERSKPLRLRAAQRRAIGGDIAKAAAMPQPANGQFGGCDVGEPEPP